MRTISLDVIHILCTNLFFQINFCSIPIWDIGALSLMHYSNVRTRFLGDEEHLHICGRTGKVIHSFMRLWSITAIYCIESGMKMVGNSIVVVVCKMFVGISTQTIWTVNTPQHRLFTPSSLPACSFIFGKRKLRVISFFYRYIWLDICIKEASIIIF